MIRTNIQFVSTNGRQAKTLVVTSSGAGEGKSTTAANLAVVVAQSGQQVLLVDADMRKPVLSKIFQLSGTHGLSNLLSSLESSLGEELQQTTIKGLNILPSGPIPPNPSELLSSQRMTQLMQEVSQLYDMVIFDLPPVVAVTDAQILASKADGTLLVVRERNSRKEALTKAKELLEIAQAKILGVVYNGVEKSKENNYYYEN
ncbi:MAG: CpsD/CapB family tyrosine-protein kinase [Enterococcus lacertideformus]|uniref:Tyrosine-protein kinase CpsD n=1 Tax=Enterococcus lacertideformus TaxID=2771493 RepID=A0A931FC42_9ENTE|nr:CpsD/CapB family tyrosine-protein kinase [Enterococcus lacertideformus]